MNISDMLREKTVFGPISSRRLGQSLGINLLPEEGKLCNFDCLYCECGWNRDGREDTRIPSASQVRSALESKLESLKEQGVRIDSITFAGDGEPTLNPDFPVIVDDTLELRDMYYPEAKVSVLSNATRIADELVFGALLKVDNPILKLDAAFEDDIRYVNRPCGSYSLRSTVEALKRFEGNFVLQTMLFRSADYDPFSCGRIEAWMDIVRELHPREVMVYTIDRPTPETGLEKISPEEMRERLEPLFREGYSIQIRG